MDTVKILDFQSISAFHSVTIIVAYLLNVSCLFSIVLFWQVVLAKPKKKMQTATCKIH